MKLFFNLIIKVKNNLQTLKLLDSYELVAKITVFDNYKHMSS